MPTFESFEINTKSFVYPYSTLLVFDKDQIAPGNPGFLGVEGDTNNLKVLELHIKCVIRCFFSPFYFFS
jgi:hypothetical protein